MKKKKGGGLKKWFKENWVDISTGKPCGRKSASKSVCVVVVRLTLS